MRSLTSLLTSLVLASCATAPAALSQPAPQQAPPNPTVEFLLASAATEFHTHRPPDPARFRDVRSGYKLTPEGERQYLVCGEFLPAGEGGAAEWVPFATIKTSGYEQWVGGPAVGLCTRPATTWDEGDLSSPLQSRLDSLARQPGTSGNGRLGGHRTAD
jgi:hypothetical protein